MDKVAVYILAGGKSSRFGSDKTRALVQGVPLIVRVVEQLRPIASRITVVADRPDKYQDLGLSTIADKSPGMGPLAGIQAALAHHGSCGWLLCASSDRIGIRPQWVHLLLAQTGADVDVVAFRCSIWQPFPALYRGALGSKADDDLALGNTSPWRLIESVRARALPLPSDWDTSLDVNDRQALRHWRHG